MLVLLVPKLKIFPKPPGLISPGVVVPIPIAPSEAPDPLVP